MEYSLTQKDDQAKFKQYFDAYYKPVRNYLFYKTGDKDLADDATQQVFLRLWEIRETIKQDTVKSLIYTIATNIVLNHFKHQKVVYQFAMKQSDEHSESDSADFELRQKEFNDKLNNVLEKIPENSRNVFLMNRIEELSYNEIAERLGLSVKAIEKRMHQALEIIKTHLSHKI